MSLLNLSDLDWLPASRVGLTEDARSDGVNEWGFADLVSFVGSWVLVRTGGAGVRAYPAAQVRFVELVELEDGLLVELEEVDDSDDGDRVIVVDESAMADDGAADGDEPSAGR